MRCFTHAAFTAWAWGDPGLADIRIVLPPKFSGEVRALPTDTPDQLTSTTKDGRLSYAADDIAKAAEALWPCK